jgi:hypothetical protein
MRKTTLHRYAQVSLLIIWLTTLACVATDGTETSKPTIGATKTSEATMGATETSEATTGATKISEVKMKEPLITHIYTADPSAHVFEGKLYI